MTLHAVGGITGQFYRQFALTIAGATVISMIVSLTLSPAMCTLLLRPHTGQERVSWWTWPTRLLFRGFNWLFDGLAHGYGWLTRRLVRIALIMLLAYAGILAYGLNEFRKTPVGFIPNQDVGYLIGVVQLPPGATVGPAGFPIMPFSFAFTGSFTNLGDFFRRIEGFVSERREKLAVKGRLLTLEGLQLKPDTEGFPHIRATVTATSYLTSPLEGATGGATAAGPAGAAATAPGATTTPDTGAGGVAAPSTATSTGAIR